MAERSSLTQTVQWGVETTGASASPTILMSALGFDLSPETEGGDFRPAGQKFKTLAWVSKLWTEGSISGQATYTEILFPLSSVLTKPTTAAATSGYTYTFFPSATGSDDPRTFTVDSGENGNFNRVTNVIFKEFGLSFDRNQIQISGSAYGRALVQETGNMAAGTSLSSVMVLPKDVCVYMSTTYAAITASPSGAYDGNNGGKLGRVLSTEFSVGNRYNPVWVLDCAEDSYVASVEAEPELRAGLMVEANTQGMLLMQDLKSSATRFLRIEATSDETIATGGGDPYKLTVDMAVKVRDTDGFSDEDGLYAIGWNMIGINDSQLGGAIKVGLTTSVAPSAYPALLTAGA